MGEALGWLAAARDCMDDPCNSLTRGLLTIEAGAKISLHVRDLSFQNSDEEIIFFRGGK